MTPKGGTTCQLGDLSSVPGSPELWAVGQPKRVYGPPPQLASPLSAAVYTLAVCS
jgi:hypothetical protein